MARWFGDDTQIRAASFDGHSDFGMGTFATELTGTLVLDH
jgi:hypothetical protein